MYSGMAAFGIVVTEVHIHLTAPDGSGRDTVIAFAPPQTDLVVDIPVAVGQDGQPFTVLLELRNDAHVVLFSGTQIVTAHAAGFNGLNPPFIDLVYTGPGQGVASVTVTPANPTTSSSAPMPFSASALNASGQSVAGLLVNWTSSDITVATATSTSDATAIVTALGKRGVATITATTPLGVSGTSRFTFVPPTARVVVISGGGQTGVAGSTLAQPLVVEVQATDNLPVPGAQVTFRALTSGGSVPLATVIADANGRASTTMTLGHAAGVYQFDATSGSSSSVSVNETATPAPAAALAIVSGDAQTNAVGHALTQPLVVKVSDQFGGAVSGATVTWTRLTGTGTLGAASSQSDVNGLASITYTLGATVGTESVQASLAGVTGSAGAVVFSMTANNLAPVAITIISGGNQSGAPDDVLPAPLVAKVTDAAGAGVPNVSVTWSASPTGTIFAPVTSSTNASGQVSATATLGSTLGPVTVTATAGALTASTTLTITSTGPATQVVVVLQPSSTAQLGIPFAAQPAVKIADANGNAVPQAGVNVVAAIFAGGGTLTGTQTVQTNASGVATFTNLALDGNLGVHTLQFISGTLISATSSAINVTAGPATRLGLTTAPSPTASSGAPLAVQPVVQVQDTGGNPSPTQGVTVTATIAGGTGTLTNATATTNASGVATFSGLTITGPPGTVSLQFAATGLASVISGPIAIGAGTATHLAFITQPSTTATNQVPFASQPAIQLRDASNNPVATAGVTVIVSVTAGNGNVTTAGATTDATGTATYTNLGILGQVGNYTIQFVAGALPALPFGPIVLVAGAPTQLIVTTQPPPTVPTGVAFSPQPVVQVADQSGNPVLQTGIPVTAAIATGGGTLNGTLVVNTNGSGAANYTNLNITGTVGTRTLRFTSGTLTSVLSNTINVTAGTGTLLAITTQPSANATNGTPFATQPVLQLEDAGGNPVLIGGVVVTATIATGTGTLNNFTAISAANGSVTFAGLTLTGTAGNYSLQFSAPGYTAVTSGNITLTAGLATQMSFTTPPSLAATNGAAFAQQPVVQLRDASSNAVPGAGVVITASVTTGTGIVLNGNALTAPNGSATFSGLGIQGIAGNFTLTFTTGGSVTPLPFGPIALSAGTATQLLVATQPSTTAQVGVAFPQQPSIQVADLSGNAVAGAGVSVLAAIQSGGGTLNGTATVTTNASGLATFTNLNITGAPGPRTLRFQSGSLNNAVSGTINVTTGPGSQMAFTTPPSTTAGSGAPLTTQPVIQLQDAAGNPVSQAGVVVSVTITPGTGTVTGGTATSNASGVVTFTALTISGAPGPYTLHFAATGYTTLSSGTITLAGPNTLITKPGTRLSADQVNTTIPSIKPIFQARDGAGAALVGKSVLITVTGRCTIGGQTSITLTTDGNGEVQPNMLLPFGANGAGCVVRATGASFTTATDSALLAVFPTNTTHIWVGSTNTNWSTASNWVGPVNTLPASAAPGALDQAFVPFYFGILNQPKLSAATTVRKLALDTFALVDVNLTKLSIGDLGVTGLGLVQNGTTELTTTASLAGIFDKLAIGQQGNCGGMMGTLTTVTAKTLDLYCAAKIDTTAVSVSTDLTVFQNGGALSLTQARAGLIVGGNALFTGDSLTSQGGNIVVQGNSQFAGNFVNVSSGTFNLIGTADFQSSQNSIYSSMLISIGGDVSFGGNITGTQNFAGGTLSLSGNFTQNGGELPTTFLGTSDHVTQFTGAATQTISFGTTQSYFGILRLANSSAGGVVILNNGSAQNINGTTQPRVDLISGKLTLDTNSTFFGNGNVRLGTNTILNLLSGSNFQISSGVCTGRTTNNATITGPGSVNGAPYTPSTCTP